MAPHACSNARTRTRTRARARRADIPGAVQVTEGLGGLPKVVLSHASGSKAEVCVFVRLCPARRFATRLRLSLRSADIDACASRLSRHTHSTYMGTHTRTRHTHIRHTHTRHTHTHDTHARSQVYLFGGLIASWTQPSGDEVLYVRPDAVFDKSKPISGGIPHCWPQFGPGVMQQHGFARNLDWEIGSTSADLSPDERDPSVELVLTDNDYTRAMWYACVRLRRVCVCRACVCVPCV